MRRGSENSGQGILVGVDVKLKKEERTRGEVMRKCRRGNEGYGMGILEIETLSLKKRLEFFMERRRKVEAIF